MSLRPRLVAAAVLLFLCAALAPAQTTVTEQNPSQLVTLSRQQLDVIKVLVAQEKAWNNGDLGAFAQGYKDSAEVLFIGHQVSRGYDQMLFDYKQNYPNREAMGTLSYSELEAHPLDEKFTVVLGKYRLDRSKKAGGSAEGLFSLILEKTDKGWKIIVDHTT
jgi:ketosteroid isomerase-like protein